MRAGSGTVLAGPSNGNTPNRPRMVRARERDRQALELRMEGLSFDAIAAQIGVTREAARQAVNRSLDMTLEVIAEKAEELRAIEAERLEAITSVLWPRVMEGDLQATDRLLRTRESFRRLTGLDLSPDHSIGGPQIVVIDSRPPWSREENITDAEVEELPALPAPSDETGS